MGVYTRFKKNPEGFRQLVELVESTPLSRQKKMIHVGMMEDPQYTEKLIQYMLKFQDIVNLPDLELAEVLAQCPPMLIAYAIYQASDTIKKRFIQCSLPAIAIEIQEHLQSNSITNSQIGAGQIKLITITRTLERQGTLKVKRIPLHVD